MWNIEQIAFDLLIKILSWDIATKWMHLTKNTWNAHCIALHTLSPDTYTHMWLNSLTLPGAVILLLYTHTHSLISFFDPVFDHNRQFISLYSVSLHEIHLDLFNSFEMEFSIAHMHHFIWTHTKWTNRNDTGKILIFIDMVCDVWYRRLMSKSQITKGNSIETSATSLPLSRQLLK